MAGAHEGDEPLPATEENVERALRFVKKLATGGGTNYHAALQAALQRRDHDTIYFLSDGQPSAGELRSADEICAWFRAENARRGLIVNTVGTGGHDAVLRRLSLENQGVHRSLR